MSNGVVASKPISFRVVAHSETIRKRRSVKLMPPCPNPLFLAGCRPDRKNPRLDALVEITQDSFGKARMTC